MLDAPVLSPIQRAAADWSVLPAFMPVPGLGALAVNSFLLEGPEPMLVDTGLAALADPFVAALEQAVDLSTLNWIWLSHLDADHTGALAAILDRAPRARVVTSFLGAGKMGLAGIDPARAHVLQPGDRFEVGGRSLVPLRPPYYDAPETLGFFDPASRVLFAADSFGALLPAPADSVEAIAPDDLRDGMVAWSAIDAPWLQLTDPAALAAALNGLARLDPAVVLSGHLPLACGPIEPLARIVADAWASGAERAPDPLAAEAVAAALAA
ncbi:MAG: MBL fold metallo-hydrolase [Phenylobacterium sp.]|uniref:MBL fold metallo-hydrolase n=1 Tax=Phenylobacterium sp. TaxID=1871053 RepID=UPI00391A7296